MWLVGLCPPAGLNLAETCPRNHPAVVSGSGACKVDSPSVPRLPYGLAALCHRGRTSVRSPFYQTDRVYTGTPLGLARHRYAQLFQPVPHMWRKLARNLCKAFCYLPPLAFPAKRPMFSTYHFLTVRTWGVKWVAVRAGRILVHDTEVPLHATYAFFHKQYRTIAVTAPSPCEEGHVFTCRTRGVPDRCVTGGGVKRSGPARQRFPQPELTKSSSRLSHS